MHSLLLKIREGEAEASAFTPGAQAYYFPDRIKGTGEHLASSGELGALSLIGRSRQAEYTQRRYRATLGETDYLFRFLLDPKDRVHAYDFEPD